MHPRNLAEMDAEEFMSFDFDSDNTEEEETKEAEAQAEMRHETSTAKRLDRFKTVCVLCCEKM